MGRRALGMDNPAGPPPSAGFRIFVHADCLLSVSPLSRSLAELS